MHTATYVGKRLLVWVHDTPPRCQLSTLDHKITRAQDHTCWWGEMTADSKTVRTEHTRITRGTTRETHVQELNKKDVTTSKMPPLERAALEQIIPTTEQ